MTAAGGALRVLLAMECTIGGTRRHLRDLAQGLRAKGVEVDLAVAAEREPGFRADLAELARAGCGVHELPMRRAISPRLDARHFGELTRLLRELRPDVVHTHSSKAGVLGRLASLRAGVGARVHTPHTFAFLFREMFGPAKRILFRSIERGLAARTDALIAVSPGEAKSFATSGVVPASKVRVVPNGIDPTPFEGAQSADLESFGLDAARPCAVVVGLLNAAKGHDLALRALAEGGAPEELQLLVVGDGEDRPELEALVARLGLGERVRFAGFRDDVPALLAAGDCLLLPSRWEGMPYVVLEAMAAGRPVVATPVDGARDLVVDGGTGILAEAIDAGGIGAALARLFALEHGEREALGAAGRERVRADYDLANMVEGTLAVYHEVLGTSAARIGA